MRKQINKNSKMHFAKVVLMFLKVRFSILKHIMYTLSYKKSQNSFYYKIKQFTVFDSNAISYIKYISN